jgi:hypothetical protein
MRALQRANGTFQKVGECLYRYSSNGVYYARIKTSDKEIRRSLETTDRDLAKRNLAKLKDEQHQVVGASICRRIAIDHFAECLSRERSSSALM